MYPCALRIWVCLVYCQLWLLLPLSWLTHLALVYPKDPSPRPMGPKCHQNVQMDETCLLKYNKTTWEDRFLTLIAYGRPGLMKGGVKIRLSVNGVSTNLTFESTASWEIPPDNERGFQRCQMVVTFICFKAGQYTPVSVELTGPTIWLLQQNSHSKKAVFFHGTQTLRPIRHG